MSLADFLKELRALNVNLSLDGDKLKVSAPKGAITPALQLKLREHKEDLLQLLLASRDAAGQEVLEPILAHPPEEPAPLSSAQHRLWFLDQLTPGTASLNLPFTVRLIGDLDVDALRSAIEEIGRRHDALKSRIRLVGDEPMQSVGDQELELVVLDFSHLPEFEREKAMLDRRAEEMGRPFPLDQSPLIRFFLFKKAPRDHWFMFVTHHVVFDGWSHDVLFREVRELYQAKHLGTELPKAPSTRFADFVRWHRDWVKRGAQAGQLDSWKARLEGMPQVLDLPTDHQRPATLTHRGANAIWKIPEDLVEKLRRIALANGATLNMLALASVELLLYRYTGQKDFGIGVPVHGRIRPECEELIGMFVNTLVVRSDIEGSTTFRDLLIKVRDTSISALSHQDVPFENLVQALEPARERNRTPLYQVAFSYQEASRREYRMAGLELEQIPSFSGSTGTDMTLWVRDHGSWALAVVELSLDVFKNETAERWLRSWQCLLHAIAENPDVSIYRVPVIADSDRQGLLNLAQGKPSEAAADTMHAMIERVAEQHPERKALFFEDQSLSFSELDRRANRLAQALFEKGVSQEVLVGVCLPRSLDLVVAMLAVFKAGGGYVPLDPTVPKERLEYFIADARAKVVVTASHLAEKVRTAGTELLLIDRDQAQILAQPSSPPEVRHSPSQVAYVIYTSGSTGKPKGVVVEHRNAMSLFAAFRAFVGLENGVWMAGASTSFDMSIPEIWGALCHGLPVVIVGDMVLGNARETRFGLAEIAARYHVTHYECTPSQARLLLLDPKTRAMLGALDTFIVGGEALPQDLGDELAKVVPGRVINGYGPTEVTAYSTMDDVKAGERITIGACLPGISGFVVDEHLNLVPLGSPGELCLGGPSVTRGYLDRPELTRERFIDNPFGGHPRLYRSGDLVRQLADGRFLYLGRNDHQVKIRGFRVELGEVEATLCKVSGVKASVVTAFGSAEDKRLVAYLEIDDAFQGEAALRQELRKVLPEFMVPSNYITLREFPLNPNGKVDRSKLPKPSFETKASDYVSPTDEIEARVCAIWSRALGRPQVGLTDSFFDLGGHSLLAVRIFNELHDAYGVRLPLAALFDGPTPGELASRIRKLKGSNGHAVQEAWTTIVPIVRAGTKPPFFCVAGIGGNPMNLIHLAQAMPDQPFYGLQYRGVDGELSPHRTIRDMAMEFLADVRRVQPNGPYYFGGYSMGGVPAYEMAMLLQEQGEQVGLVVLLDTFNPTLPGWTMKERLLAHLGRLRNEGPAYIGNRVQDRLARERQRIRTRWQAYRQHDDFKRRHELVERACEEAASAYIPGYFAGDVVLIRAAARLGPSDGIGHRTHESNGWRDYVTGRLTIEQIDCRHLDIVRESTAPETARILAAALAQARSKSVKLPAAPRAFSGVATGPSV